MQHQIKIVRNLKRALALKVSSANNNHTLGLNITTPQAYLCDVWALFGDGRSLVEGSFRTLLMRLSLRDCKHKHGDNFGLQCSYGTAKLLCSFLSQYGGCPSLVQEIKSFSSGDVRSLHNLSQSQIQVLDVLMLYLTRLQDFNLIEPSEAAYFLCKQNNISDLKKYARVEIEEELFVSKGLKCLLQNTADSISGEPNTDNLLINTKCRFKFTTGMSALTFALYDEISYLNNQDFDKTIIFCSDPLQSYKSIVSNLSDDEVTFICNYNISIQNTQLGRAIHSVKLMLSESLNWKMHAADFAYSKLSGLSIESALKVNSAIRSDSLMTLEHCIKLLVSMGSCVKTYIDLITDPNAKTISNTISDVSPLIKEMPFNTNAIFDERDIEFNALYSLENVISISSNLPNNINDSLVSEIFDEWERESLSLSVSSKNSFTKNGKIIEFSAFDALDNYAPSSIDHVIFVDLTKSSINVSSARPATDSLLHILGISPDLDIYHKIGAMFISALSSARKSICCIMPMHDGAGKQLYPSFMYDELINIVDSSSSNYADKDKVFRVPEIWEAAGNVFDESDLIKCFGETFTEIIGSNSLEPISRGKLTSLDISDYIAKTPNADSLPILSPSQIELYVSCPYNWFVSRKLNLKEIDEELNAAKMGQLVHKTYEQMYDILADQNIYSINTENVDIAKEIASKEFDDILEKQKFFDKNKLTNISDRIVASTEHEESSINYLKWHLLKSIDRMALLPGSFKVKAHEVKLNSEHNINLPYAGAIISGRVDRVDVDEDHNYYVVIDYKSKIDKYYSGYDLLYDVDTSNENPFELKVLPEKIQTLIYAQVLREHPDYKKLNPVGAVYMAYKESPYKFNIAGSIDAEIYDISVATYNASKSEVPAGKFIDFLDGVEQLVKPYVDSMLEGHISPNQQTNICQWCPAVFCSARKA